MEKRVLLGVQKKKNPIKKRFLKKIEDYMKSDSYMFARLITKPHIASKTSTSSTTGNISFNSVFFLFHSSANWFLIYIYINGMFNYALRSGNERMHEREE